ncbi:uncharacterized protein GGS22DRAFT_65616 [Annulohypoxylon maeteangense]|uniref:uncharacterized protein n=1 Tax=Annulohypoxylon maeteangense TaxID=1927788 RepID=UPI002008AEEE|nr:uncharacterized protein GGS22DRAFT_65616 [Annulohypoxylon maeteangense]KAI0888983.1 hypothetical protein GGS22DRAFT_65616 [Annulohypoxylon maeteangense]
MLFQTVSSIAIMALAGQAIAEPVRQPYKLKLAQMSAKSIFGLDRRDDGGYSPEQQFCGSGDTCDEACGKGFAQCPSKDGIVHCFNKAGNQTCCPGKTGDSCDQGYFCSADDKGNTWCCPDSMTLKQCAAAYSLPGSLIVPTPTSTSTPSSTNASATKSATSLKIVGSASATGDYGSTATEPPTTTAAPAATSSSSSPSPTAPDNGIVAAGTDSIRVPASGAILLIVAAFAALL